MVESAARTKRIVGGSVWAGSIAGLTALYFLFLAPPHPVSWLVHARFLLFVVILATVIFKPWRSTTTDLSERQQFWAVGYRYWAALAFLAIVPFSLPLAIAVAGVIFVGSILYLHLVRET